MEKDKTIIRDVVLISIGAVIGFGTTQLRGCIEEGKTRKEKNLLQ